MMHLSNNYNNTKQPKHTIEEYEIAWEMVRGDWSIEEMPDVPNYFGGNQKSTETFESNQGSLPPTKHLQPMYPSYPSWRWRWFIRELGSNYLVS